MLRYRNIACLLFISVAFRLTAQQNTILQPPDSIKIQGDSAMLVSPRNMVVEKKTFKPDPKKAVIYSAIFPGLGQIYNRKYWKLPIIYGGFVGFTYAITWNNSHYQAYFGGYKDILDDNPDTNRWHELVPYQYRSDPESVDKQWFSGVLKDRKNYFRYYRDFSIILTVAWYALGIVDAYVDAQLFEFNVSPDLSMRLEPVILRKTDINYLANSYGLRCSFSF